MSSERIHAGHLGTAPMDRRSFLRRGAFGGVAAGVLATGGLGTLLAACGSTSTAAPSASGSGAKDLGTYALQLGWVKDVEFAGEYIADSNGYYKEQGFSSVNLISGGPNVAPDAVVAAGKALLGISSPPMTAAAILQGAPIVTIGAQYQKNPFAIMSLASSPIPDPKAMIGKKIGVQSTNLPIWNAFLKANNIKPSSISVVPVQFDPSPLVAHEVDGWFAFITNEPNLLKVKGVATHTFLLNDYHYPSVSETYVARTDSLSGSKLEMIKAALVGEIKGWQRAVQDPVLGAKLTVNTYGKSLGLTVAEQTLEAESQNGLIVTADTKANGLFTITPKLIDESIATLKLGGTSIAPSKLFDMSALDQVYSENPSLKSIS